MEIGPQTTMGEILGAHPSARIGLFQKYHIGGCQSCGYELGETLGAVMQRHHIKATIEEVIACIRDSAPVEARLHADPVEVAAALRDGRGIHLVDVRTPEEFAAGHLDRARLLTVPLTFEMLDEWPKDAPIVVYSNHGRRSLDKASYFTAYGLTNVKSLDGGIEAFTRIAGRSQIRAAGE